jgi:hypothetical protein
MRKFATLLQILDELCKEAPDEFKSYHPDKSDPNLIINSRCQAFIHLFLKVKFGITDFQGRHELITDGQQDGGLDAYYIDKEQKKLFLIQSKFRSTSTNFKEKSIDADDLVRMEITKVLKGETTDSKGNKFNDKIILFQKKWREISDQAKYNIYVIILGNLKNYSDDQIKRLIDNSNYIVYDYQRTYNELVMPLCSGTYYEPDQIEIAITLAHKNEPTLNQRITTKNGDYEVWVVFVPALEIGRILSIYRNSMLIYNPRNYLSLENNEVNINIRNSITETETNDFALLNNGITIISDSCNISVTTGRVDRGQIILTNPQIINGGQTAYTLSNIYEENTSQLNRIFDEKEVLLKIIIGVDENARNNYQFIDEISNATNQQSRVEEADRRSNDPKQIDIQNKIFSEFGFYYERKSGEYYYGIKGKYITEELIINRYELLRSYLAFKGQPRFARQRGNEILFRKDNYHEIIKDTNDYKQMVFAYTILQKLKRIEKKSDTTSWGSGLRYGKMAIISAIGMNKKEILITSENLEILVIKSINAIKPKWAQFEHWARRKKENIDYIHEGEFNYDNYYKGKTINSDIKQYYEKL